jgi:hypothetical protein
VHLGTLATTLGAPRIAVEQSGRNDILFRSCSGVYAAVAMLMRFRVLEAVLGDHERYHENLDGRDSKAHDLLNMF